NCNLERELLDRSTQFIKFLNISEEEKNNLRKQTHILIGKSYEREAQLRHSKGEHPLVLANQCYLPASEEYLKAGDNKKREENLILFNKNNHFNPEDCHEYSVPIPNSILTPFEGETEADVIKSISENDLVFPDEDDIMNQINRELSEHPLLLGVSHLKLSNVGPTSGVAIKEDDIKKHLVHERKILHIQSYENFICQSILK